MQKIVIRAPAEVGKQAATLAVIQFLQQKKPQTSIEVIVDADQPHLYGFVETVRKIHEMPQEKDKVLNVFPWVHNNKDLFAIDAYLDLRSSSASATLGIALKARMRIGFASAFTKTMFNKSLPIEKSYQFLDEHYLSLCEFAFEEKIPGQLNGKFPHPNEKEEAQLKVLGDFLFIGIKSSYWHRHRQIWQHWFTQLSGGTLVVVLDQDDDDFSARDWLLSNKSENFLVMQKNDPRASIMLMAYARGVLSDSPLYAHVATYYGQNVAVLSFDLEDYPTFATFSPRPQIFLERENLVSTWISSDGERLIVDQEEATEALFKIFNL